MLYCVYFGTSDKYDGCFRFKVAAIVAYKLKQYDDTVLAIEQVECAVGTDDRQKHG